jgi:hypothetical protein
MKINKGLDPLGIVAYISFSVGNAVQGRKFLGQAEIEVDSLAILK